MTKLFCRKFIKSRSKGVQHVTAVAGAIVCACTVPSLGLASPADTGRSADLEEIIVTAQKRQERLQDVPVPVAVITADALVNTNQARLQDYYTQVPGLSLTTLGDGGGASVAIRGLTTGGFINPTVGVVVDDIPFGASTVAASGNFIVAPDIDPSELSQVEVLRGPQGTLYGASSLGGLLKFVTVDPSTERSSGSLQVGTTSVRDGDDLGYSVRGAVNVPVTDRLAVRVSASTRSDPGYIDNVQSGQKDINETESQSARAVALWTPTDSFSLKVGALYQDTERKGSADVTLPPPLGVAGLRDLQISAQKDTGQYEQKFQAYNVTAKLNMGEAELTSLSGYSVSTLSNVVDVTPTYGAFATLPTFGVRNTVVVAEIEARKFSQEFKFSTPLGQHAEWLLGLFYTRETTPPYLNDTVAVTPGGAVVGTGIRNVASSSYREYAAFTDVLFKITDRFDVQVGGRASRNKVAFSGVTGVGPFYTVFRFPNPYVTPATETKDESFSYLLTPRFKFSEDIMMYARLASGYRPGGANTITVPTATVPTTYEHDTTENYEIGMKGNILDHALSFDASVYYIDWKDVQLQLRDPANITVQYIFNAGAATSKGAEVSLEMRPFDATKVSLVGAYNDAKLTSVPTNSVLTARAGDRLPYSAEWTGSLGLEQEFPLMSNATGFAGASLSYVGDRKGRFFQNTPQGAFPSYTQLDVRLGARFDAWTLNAFCNNATDKRGVLRAGNDSFNSYKSLITYTQPRTIGLSLTRTF